MAPRYWLMRFSACIKVVALTVITEAGTSYHFGKLIEIIDVVLEPVDHVLEIHIFASEHHGVASHDGPFFFIRKGKLKKQVSKQLDDRFTEQSLDKRGLP